MIAMFYPRLLVLLFLLSPRFAPVWAGEENMLDLSSARIVIRAESVSEVEATAAQVLSEEIERRTGIVLPVGNLWPVTSTPVIVVASRSGGAIAGHELPLRSGENLPEAKPEGFAVTIRNSDPPVVWCLGADPRGALFGVGCILRNLIWEKGKAQLPADLGIYTSPAYPLRGHQLGYRTQANSYDAWTPEQFDQHIRELALFGTNAIEGIPFQDDRPNPHMKVSRREMNRRMSEICHKYDLEYWVWFPAEFALEKQDARKELLALHEDLCKSAPRLDGIFFPGGDPGDNPPELVLPFLKEVADILVKYHPKGGVWLSLQGFDEEKTRYTLEYIKKEKPSWLKGVVGGPSSPPLQILRKELPAEYPIRDYPDITHTVRCQYPVPWFDPAYSVTVGREPVNPRPVFYAGVIRSLLPYTIGFISYSDGMNDDINKVVWSQLGWDPSMDVRKVLIEYSRFFFGPKVAEESADGILALENNWNGPLATNGSVDGAFALWSGLAKMCPENDDNWRWLCLLLHAGYDYFTRHRLIQESNLEQEANQVLAQASTLGAAKAMEQALEILKRTETQPVLPELRKEILKVGEQLFHLIGFQTSVEKYHAIGPERGAVLDFLDRPVNNRWWLEDQFAEIRTLSTEEEKVARLKVIAEWENPGPGSFYDDVGDLAKSQHVILGEGLNTDPLMERNPPPTHMFWDGGKFRRRLSWATYMDWPIGMRYERLDPRGTYVARMTGQGDAKLRIDGELAASTVYSKEIGEIKEFPVPAKALEDGLILLTWDKLDEGHLNWRQQSSLAEVWVIKR
jgi:hypothetical protein